MTTLDKKEREYIYTGKLDRQPGPGETDKDGHPLYGYVPDKALVDAVNLAIYLKRPLLIKGEPGCGKTRLARAVAYELGLHCEPWYIKSTSRARDGLYMYDALARLHDAQLSLDIDTLTKYIHKGALWRAFESEEKTVVLIDEIDKADIDFPNDLLLELDELSFVITETGETITAKKDKEPIIFITSNDEKDLPAAFLRRCLFYYIDFPDPKRLTQIINIHCAEAAETIKAAAIAQFIELRERMKEDKQAGGKRVSTSELIDWVHALQFDADRISSEREVLDKLKNEELPDASAILKSREDQSYQKVKSLEEEA